MSRRAFENFPDPDIAPDSHGLRSQRSVTASNAHCGSPVIQPLVARTLVAWQTYDRT
ncbi:hypothetical protein IG631_07679 [Alternaria alternata]|nr:hypothetical protein IG631_07679 [Alternaria alternata]